MDKTLTTAATETLLVVKFNPFKMSCYVTSLVYYNCKKWLVLKKVYLFIRWAFLKYSRQIMEIRKCKAHKVMLTLPCFSYQHNDTTGTCVIPLQASQKTLGWLHKHGAELNCSLPKPQWNSRLVEKEELLFSTNPLHWEQV